MKKDEIIEYKKYRNISYNIFFDGVNYGALKINSIGIPEVMTYHPTLEEAKTGIDKLVGN